MSVSQLLLYTKYFMQSYIYRDSNGYLETFFVNMTQNVVSYYLSRSLKLICTAVPFTGIQCRNTGTQAFREYNNQSTVLAPFCNHSVRTFRDI